MAGTILAAMIAATASQAAMTLSNTAIMALAALGGGTSFRVMVSKTPSVPSEATMSPARL